jgi:hypothetical protein
MKTTFFLLITGLLLFTSCNLREKIEDITTFKINNSTEFSIPSSSIVNVPIDIGTPDINTSSKQTFENNNTRADLVENVNLNELKLSITNPNDRTFSFLKSLNIYISNDTEGKTLIAENQDIPENVGSTLDLETTGTDLSEYIKEDTYSLEFEAVTRETTNSKTDIKAEMIFEVRAKIL